MNDLTTTNNQGFMIVNTLADALKVADIIAKSGFCPKAFVGKSGDVLVAMQWGQEIGLKPLQALQNIAVINGRPSLWGDAMLAVCQQSPNYEFINETFDEATMTAICTAKRKGSPEVVRTFSKEDAKKAGLWGKQGPWSQYEKRMLAARACGFALRDAFADALKGLISAEEAQDYPDKKEYAKKEYSKPSGTIVDMETVKIGEPKVVPLDVQDDLPDSFDEPKIVYISPDELTILVNKMKEAGSDVGEVCKHLKIASLHFVPKAKFAGMLAKLDDKIALNKPAENAEVAEFFEEETK